MHFRCAFLLGLLFAAAAVSAHAQASNSVQMRIAGKSLTISGSGWQFTYGTLPARAAPTAELLPAAPGKLWFRHGAWLRLIDTANGNVVGRWHLPGMPVKLLPGKPPSSVEIEYEEGWPAIRQRLSFNVEAPPRAYYSAAWNDPNVSRLSACEAHNLLAANFVSGDCVIRIRPLDPAAAKAGVARLEETARHDPLSPWIHVTLAKLMHETGDPRSQAVFSRALQIASTDFSELFGISAFLDQIGEPQLAQEAFDRGCADFLKRGNIAWLAAYAPYFIPASIARRSHFERQLQEREYKLAPGSYWRQVDWLSEAGRAERQGQLDEARLWRARVQEAGERSFNIVRGWIWFLTNQFLFVLLAGILAGLGCLIFLYVRYLPEKGADGNRLFPLLCSTGAQRAAFLLIVVTVWLAAGFACAMSAGARRFIAMPFPLGSLAGAPMRQYLQNRLPASSERTLLLALSSQQEGDSAQAERLYRAVPQFAESWNNLAVLLMESGREAEARQAFERALQLDPALSEAAFNLGRPASAPWLEAAQSHATRGALLAPPSRPRLIRAFLGSRASLLARSLAGPFADSDVSYNDRGRRDRMLVFIDVLMGLAIVLPLLAVILLILPREEALQDSLRPIWYCELLLPGLSPRWRAGGGLVLMAWFYVLAVLIAWLATGNPVLVQLSWYTYSPGAPSAVLSMLYHSPFAWSLAAAGLLLFAANAVLVSRQEREEDDLRPPPTASTGQ